MKQTSPYLYWKIWKNTKKKNQLKLTFVYHHSMKWYTRKAKTQKFKKKKHFFKFLHKWIKLETNYKTNNKKKTNRKRFHFSHSLSHVTMSETKRHSWTFTDLFVILKPKEKKTKINNWTNYILPNIEYIIMSIVTFEHLL